LEIKYLTEGSKQCLAVRNEKEEKSRPTRERRYVDVFAISRREPGVKKYQSK